MNIKQRHFIQKSQIRELQDDLLNQYDEKFVAQIFPKKARIELIQTDAGDTLYAVNKVLKLWKPFFVGRNPYLSKLPIKGLQVVRFRMDEKGVRRPELGDPVLDKRGRIVGTVTSCAIDEEGFLLGQAAVPDSMIQPGTVLLVYQLGGGKRTLRVPGEVKVGSRLPVPNPATVLSRFPPRKK